MKKVFLFILLFFLLSTNIAYSRVVRSNSDFSIFLKKLDSPFVIEEVVKKSFFKPGLKILDSGIEVSFAKNTYMEIRRSGEGVVVQLFGDPNGIDQNKLDIIADNIAHKGDITEVIVLDSTEVNLNKVPNEAFSILKLNREEFNIVAQDVIGGNLAVGDLSAPEGIMETVAEMEDIVNLGLRRDVLRLNGLSSGREGLIEELEKYKDKILQDLEKVRKHGIYDNLSLDSLLGQLNWLTESLKSNRGNLIYRVFYREFILPLQRLEGDF